MKSHGFRRRLHGLVQARQSDKQTMASLEKRLQEERKCRSLLETQLANERRARANEISEANKAQQRSVLMRLGAYCLLAALFTRGRGCLNC